MQLAMITEGARSEEVGAAQAALGKVLEGPGEDEITIAAAELRWNMTTAVFIEPQSMDGVARNEARKGGGGKHDAITEHDWVQAGPAGAGDGVAAGRDSVRSQCSCPRR
ncbi:MAG: hypothetical protein H8E35_08600 [Ardenticatenia bacterium]|nr:hypothetical protein [Ardenticatenia bacterium]